MALRLLNGLLRRPTSGSVRVAADHGEGGLELPLSPTGRRSRRILGWRRDRTEAPGAAAPDAAAISLKCLDLVEHRLSTAVENGPTIGTWQI